MFIMFLIFFYSYIVVRILKLFNVSLKNFIVWYRLGKFLNIGNIYWSGILLL